MTAGAVAVPTIVPLRAPVPGLPKTAVDTNTKIELHSETPGVTIYYTLNGEKPEPFESFSPAAKATHIYQEPFVLPGGKRTIKAIAVSNDHRESFVVTKVFEVQQLENNTVPETTDDFRFMNDIPANESAKREVRKFAGKMVTGKEAWAEVQKIKEGEVTSGGRKDVHGIFSDRRKPPTGPRFLNNRFDSSGHHLTNGSAREDHLGMNGEHISSDQWLRKWKIPPDDASQALRLQRETDFLRCIYCFAPRPSDPFGRFCNECGHSIPPLPQTKLPPPAPGQMGVCIHCNTLVPLNTANCLVCEAPLGPQNVPQASFKLADKLLCTRCGTPNPPNLRNCFSCEAPLPVDGKLNMRTALHSNGYADEVAQRDGRMMACTKCGRVNSPEARFCDWCGTKPSVNLSMPVSCSKCHSANNPYAQFCGSCGVALSAPLRSDFRNAELSANSISQNHLAKGHTGAQWMPVNLVSRPLTAGSDASTQTVGLFFPSEKKLNRISHELEEKMCIEKEMRDRKPVLTAISPGRGYWRKQLEHVCNHLKAHASNNADFRALVGEPRMGKLLSATVHEDGYELSLTLNFVLRGTADDDAFIGKPVGGSRDFLSSYVKQQPASRYSSQDSIDMSGITARSGNNQKKSTKKAKKQNVVKLTEEEKLSPSDKKLLKEVGKLGEGRASEVSNLLQEGANPNCVNKDGVPVLLIASVNKHIDALPLLIQEGADVNQTGPNKGNTALHEVISLGPAGHKVIDVLLGCGANPSKKNLKGETAYDLAVKAGYESAAKKLAAHVGRSALDKFIKPRSDGDDDDDDL